MNRARVTAAWISAGLLWLSVVGVGLARLMDYDNQPGGAATPPERWPAESRIVQAADRPTLLMLAHPRCDCTQASLTELAELLARTHQRPHTVVVFIKPAGTGAEWDHSPLWRQASAIPGVTVVRDEHGAEARRFGVMTSGQMMLFGPDGTLLFSGGATGARGKVGANAGRASLLSLLDGSLPATSSTPVFGCPLFDEHEVGPVDGEHLR